MGQFYPGGISDEYLYPRQNAVWGQGQNAGVKIDDIGDRLLSPAEYDQLPSGIRSAYGGYMGYLNSYALGQKNKKRQADMYSAVQSGTYEPQVMTGSYVPMTEIRSGRGRIPTAGVKGAATGIPATTLHRDISGNVTREIAGGGVRRDVSGEIIPQTAEQVGAQMTLNRAIPEAKLDSEIEYLKKLSMAGTLRSDISLNKREEAARKLALSEKRLDVNQEQFGKKLTQQDKLQEARFAHQEKLLGIVQKFRTGQDELDRELSLNRLKILGEQSAERQKQALADRITLLDIAEGKKISAETRAAITQEKKDLKDWEETNNKLADQIMVKSLTASNKTTVDGSISPRAEMVRAGVNVRSRTPLVSQSTKFLSLDQFKSMFKEDKKRDPTPAEIERARGRHWM